QEIAVWGGRRIGLLALIISLLMPGHAFSNYATFNPNALIFVGLAGLTFILINYLNNYGFDQLEAVIANNLMALSAVFGLILSIFLYHEYPNLQNLVGGLLVIVSAIWINYVDKKTSN
ncbi:MAG TPA: hypothetical protein ENN77_00340, partial [Candidatus Wirthbacteria bacterium]|nr:hypothetical protein [Candidatus Wirthbacteria bacterium]